jgi:hypothetical protein
MPLPLLKVIIDGTVDGLTGALDNGNKSIKAFGKEVDTGIPTSKFELAVTAAKGLAKATKTVAVAGKDAAAAEEAFARQLSNVGLAGAASADATQDAITASQKLAFTDDETRNSIVALATASGDMETALGLLTTAQDVARLSGAPLEASADAVAKAFQGNDKALKALVPGLNESATGMDLVAAASDAAAGSADAFAKSSEATKIKATSAFSEIAETVGGALQPAFASLAESLKPVIAALLEILKVILPPLLKVMDAFLKVLTKVLDIVGKLAGAIAKLAEKLQALLAPLGKAVDGLKNLDLNPFSKGGAPTPAGLAASTFGASQSATSNGRGGVTINIYGDPAVIEARVTKALRDYSRRNGVGSVFAPGRT